MRKFKQPGLFVLLIVLSAGIAIGIYLGDRQIGGSAVPSAEAAGGEDLSET